MSIFRNRVEEWHLERRKTTAIRAQFLLKRFTDADEMLSVLPRGRGTFSSRFLKDDAAPTQTRMTPSVFSVKINSDPECVVGTPPVTKVGQCRV